MRNSVSIIILASSLLVATATVHAAPCRSGAAASQASQDAYQKDVQAAQEAAKRDRSSSDILGRCVAGVTAVPTAPQFPSLAEIFDQIKNKICQIASDQVNGAVSDVNGQIGGAISGINGQIAATGVGQVTGSVPTIGNPGLQPTILGAPQSAAFWSNIWK